MTHRLSRVSVDVRCDVDILKETAMAVYQMNKNRIFWWPLKSAAYLRYIDSRTLSDTYFIDLESKQRLWEAGSNTSWYFCRRTDFVSHAGKEMYV